MNPQVIVLDEPFNGLSMKVQEELLSLLVNLNKCGKTIILTTHRYDQIKEVANHFLIFKDKSIKYDFTRNQLINNNEVKDYCRML